MLCCRAVEEDAEVSDVTLRRGVDMGREERWASPVLTALTSALEEPEHEHLELFAFKALPGKSVDIRLDKTTDKYGSPSIVDIGSVARQVNGTLFEQLGEDAAGDIEINISSPGADRAIAWEELPRFRSLPLLVTFEDTDTDESEAAARTCVFEVEELNMDDETVVWRMADSMGNSPGKGRRPSKRMLAERWTMRSSQIDLMQLYVDV